MKTAITTILLILINLQIFANGGPIDGSAVVKTGRIKMIDKYNIRIVSELINIKIESDYAIYDVNYRFFKDDDYADTVTYGFPVDFSSDNVDMEEGGYIFKNSYVSYFKMYFQQKELPIQQQIDFGLVDDTVHFNKGFEGKARILCKRKWYISTINFNKQGYYELNVQYKVRNYFSDWLWSKSFLPKFSDRNLKYDLTPARYWDKGIIDTFTVKIDIQNLDSCYETYKLLGLENAVTKNGIIEFKQNNFKINSVKAFSLQYTNSNQKLSDYVLAGRLPNKKIKSIKVTSKDTTGLFDLNFSTSFTIKNKGIIEFNLNNSKIAAIYLINGDYSNSNNFQKHTKIKKIRITSDYVLHDMFGKEKKFDTIITIKSHSYRELRKNNFVSNADLIWDFGEADPINNLTITVIEPEFANNEDMYISEIIFTRDKWSSRD